MQYTENQIGRPSGGVSCFYTERIGKPRNMYIGDNTIIIRTEDLTIIGIYISPAEPTSNAIETICQALAQTGTQENIIIAGDFNSCIDKPNLRSKIILTTLEEEEEGFTLTNNPNDHTYYAPNETSTIDLILYKPKDDYFNVINHKDYWPTSAATIRKHIPIAAQVNCTGKVSKRQNPNTVKTRNQDEEKLKGHRNKLE